MSERTGVVERTFRLLGAFSDGTPELTLDEVVQRTGLSRSTAHRLAAQLTHEGALAQSRRGWRLGTKIFELGQMVPRESRLREMALPYMQELYVATGATVQLGVRSEDEVLYVEILAGQLRAPSPSRRGGHMPLHCTALGKALLAFSADGGRATLETTPALQRRTHKTIVDRRRLHQELDDVRRLHVAYDREEAATNLQCVASPIFDRDGKIMAAMSVSMPVVSAPTMGRVTPVVQSAARAMSRECVAAR